jgi:hypothetical protein
MQKNIYIVVISFKIGYFYFDSFKVIVIEVNLVYMFVYTYLIIYAAARQICYYYYYYYYYLIIYAIHRD